jgi:hypothetical protein
MHNYWIPQDKDVTVQRNSFKTALKKIERAIADLEFVNGFKSQRHYHDIGGLL